MLAHPTIRIGDTARFPLGRLGDTTVYRYRWAVTAIFRDGVLVRRLHDGIERRIGFYWWEKYRTDESETAYYARKPYAGDWEIAQKRQLATLRAGQLQRVRLQTNPTQPGFYVSARDGERYALLLGPFVDHYTALQLVRLGKELARPYESARNYFTVGYGTCRVEQSTRTGRFNLAAWA